MVSKTDEYSDEPYRENSISYDIATIEKYRTSKMGEHATAETSNLLSVNSNHDCFVENVERKANLRTSDVPGSFGDVEISPKLPSRKIFGGNNPILKSDRSTSKNFITNMFDDAICIEGHDDNISSVSGAEEGNKFSGSVIQSTDRSRVPRTSSSVDCLAVEVHGKDDQFLTPSASLDIKFYVEGSKNSSSQSRCNEEEVYEIKKPGLHNCDDTQSRKVAFDGGNGENLHKSEKLEAVTKNDAGDLPVEVLNCAVQSQEVEKVAHLLSSSDAEKTSMPSHHVDQSDESDIVEQDVKVCDICGDAGREDLLAICCRCSDGAEHTYCMRERLDKVPEGDWLCEECKFNVETETQRQDTFGREDGAETHQPSGKANSDIATVSVKADAKGADVEGNRHDKGPSSAKFSSKRHADDAEVSSPAKRQALESIIGSPKPANSSRLRTLSRGSSFKKIDIGRAKTTQQFPSGLNFASDSPDAARSPNTGQHLKNSGGVFLKSNSFNFSTKPKVKHADEVHLKQRSSKESTLRDTREGAVRGFGKSMSFKSTNMGHLSTRESRVKMLSPKFSHVQDLKGLKHSSEKSFFERKNSFKSPRSSVNPTASGSTSSLPKVDQKLGSHCESVSLSSTSNAEMKAVQTDDKLSLVPKPINHGPRRGAEGAVSTGELKRQLSCLPIVIGAASPNEISSFLQKPVEDSMKDDSSSNSVMAEDEFPKPRESTYRSERIKENSTSFPRHSNNVGGTSVACQKCKEIGHSAQLCTVDCPRSLSSDSSASRSSREVINNKLKAAIEAAILKKPSIYRKSRMPCPSDEVSVSSMNNETASQDQLSSSSSMRSGHFVEVIEGQAMLQTSDDLSKQTNGSNAKQFMVLPAEAFTSRSGDDSAVDECDRKHFNMELPGHASAAMSLLLQMSAIPDHEYIWQGSFEVHRSGRSPELWDGFQAHLSTCASPKVTEAINQFPRKVLFDEVPRLSAWPVQFEESGAKEDNIALYFFAREFESYERSYKILLERMMRSDLALRGSIDGVELLIFPSNQLPEKSQRWNLLFFFWGVFRGKRENGLPQGPVSANNAHVGVTEAPALMEFPSLSSAETNRKQQESKPYSNSSYFTDINLDQPLQTMAENVSSDSELEGEVQVSLLDSVAVSGTNTSGKMTFDLSVPHDRQQASANNPNKFPADPQDMVSFSNINKKNVLHNNMNNSQDIVKCSRNLVPDGGSLDAETDMVRGMVTGVQIKREVNNWQLDHRKRPYVGPTENISDVAFAGTSQTKNDPVGGGESGSKKQKTGPYEWNNFNANYSGDLASRVRDGALNSPIKDVRQFDTPSEDTGIPMDLENNGERFFFPVDPPHLGMGNNVIPWIGSTLLVEEEDKLQDRVPNLELALGAEMKPPRQPMPPSLVGKIDINLDEQPLDPEEEEEDASASLSLSLSFPIPGKETGVPAVAGAEQPMPGKLHVNPSVLLFGGFSDK